VSVVRAAIAAWRRGSDGFKRSLRRAAWTEGAVKFVDIGWGEGVPSAMRLAVAGRRAWKQ